MTSMGTSTTNISNIFQSSSINSSASSSATSSTEATAQKVDMQKIYLFVDQAYPTRIQIEIAIESQAGEKEIKKCQDIFSKWVTENLSSLTSEETNIFYKTLSERVEGRREDHFIMGLFPLQPVKNSKDT